MQYADFILIPPKKELFQPTFNIEWAETELKHIAFLYSLLLISHLRSPLRLLSFQTLAMFRLSTVPLSKIRFRCRWFRCRGSACLRFRCRWFRCRRSACLCFRCRWFRCRRSACLRCRGFRCRCFAWFRRFGRLCCRHLCRLYCRHIPRTRATTR